MRRLHVCLQEVYEEHRNDYHEHIADWRRGPNGDFVTRFVHFPSFPEWVGRPDGVPGGEVAMIVYTIHSSATKLQDTALDSALLLD